jgi:hypothetical protein
VQRAAGEAEAGLLCSWCVTLTVERHGMQVRRFLVCQLDSAEAWDAGEAFFCGWCVNSTVQRLGMRVRLFFAVGVLT